MTIGVKIVDAPRGYSLLIVSGYRAGNLISYADASSFIQEDTRKTAIQWPNIDACRIWAESTGYTVVKGD